jgi:uncharacterized membrane protein
MARAGGEHALNWLRIVGEAASKFFIPAATLTLLSGVGLVLVDDAYDWSAAFVWVGIGVVVVALGLVSSVMTPSVRKAIAAAESGDLATAGANGRKVAAVGSAIGLLLVLTEIAMVLRLGG